MASGVAVEVAGRSDDLYLQSRLAAPDNFEPAVSVAQLVLSDDGVAIDLGACLGIVSVAISTLVPNGKVLAVEASPHLIEGLQRTLSIAPLPNIELVAAAAGATSGTAIYHADPTGGAWGYISEGIGDLVEETTVDQLVQARGLDRVDFIKLDIEGRELSALHGSESTIETYHPVLVVELNPFCLWRYGRTLPQDLTSWISERYTHMWAIDDTGAVFKLTTEADIDEVLARVGTGGGLVDVVAASAPIEFPPSLWEPTVATTLEAEPQRPEPLPSRRLRRKVAGFFGRH